MLKPYAFAKFFILLIVVSALSSCMVTRHVVSQTYAYDDDISFNIQRIEELNSIATGSGQYSPSKGNMFVAMYVTLKNASGEKKELNFNNFYLLDEATHTKYKLEFSMLQTAVNIWAKTDSKIDAHDTKKRRLVFVYPKKHLATLFMANEHIYPIEYHAVTK